MKADLLYRKSRKDSDDNMIPLINIVFLLLIFFMVAGQMKQFQTADLSLPVSSSQQPVADGDVRIEISRQNNLYLNGRSVSIDELAVGFSLVALTKNQTVVLHVDKRVKASQLNAVLNVVRKQGIPKISLYTEQAVTDAN